MHKSGAAKAQQREHLMLLKSEDVMIGPHNQAMSFELDWKNEQTFAKSKRNKSDERHNNERQRSTEGVRCFEAW